MAAVAAGLQVVRRQSEVRFSVRLWPRLLFRGAGRGRLVKGWLPGEGAESLLEMPITSSI